MFGGKGQVIAFYDGGDELFEVMCELERDMGVQAFFVMDENFLLYQRRALRLLELMQQHDKAWALYVFSSADALRRYTMEQLVGLGVSWVWMGLEGEGSEYQKLQGTDTRALVRELQEHGIRVLGSTIIGLAGAHAGEHRRRHRLRRGARHRVPPVHALHAGARARRSTRSTQRVRDAAAGDGLRARGLARAVEVQLQAPVHPGGAGDRVPAARLQRATSR